MQQFQQGAAPQYAAPHFAPPYDKRRTVNPHHPAGFAGGAMGMGAMAYGAHGMMGAPMPGRGYPTGPTGSLVAQQQHHQMVLVQVADVRFQVSEGACRRAARRAERAAD